LHNRPAQRPSKNQVADWLGQETGQSANFIGVFLDMFVHFMAT
jgi:hypothetical protein